MKPRWNLSATLLLAALAAYPTPAPAQPLPLAPGGGIGLRLPDAGWSRSSSTPWVTGEVIVRFRDEVSGARRDQLVGAYGCQVARVDPGSGYALVRVRDNRVADMIGALAQRPEVLHAEPNYRMYALDQSYYDPYEWYLFDRGTISARAPSNFGIQAPSAWKHTRGAGVTVAVVDTGVAYEDYNGFYQAPGLSLTQFTSGYDIVNSTEHPNDDYGHGTFVTGVLAGNMINGGGIWGVAPAVTVMPVKALGADGGGTEFDTAQGIRWAADNGASVINLSWGNHQSGQDLVDAVNYAASKDCVLVASAGNDIPPQAVGYPAAYANCIAVGATGFDGARVPYSDFGASLAVVAPGGNLNDDLNGDGWMDGIVAQTFDPQQGFNSFSYGPEEGTSFSSPMVAGVAALVRAANPSLSASDVRTVIQSTALHLGSPGRNKYYGYGLVDAAAAVEAALARQSASGQ